MKEQLFSICLLVSSITTVAQANLAQYYAQQSNSCEGFDSVVKKVRDWKKVADDIVFPDKTFPRTQYKLVNVRADSIFDFIKESFPKLQGFEPNWYRSIRGEAYIPNGPVPYQLSAYFLEYYCNTNLNRTLLGDETSDWVYVFVNQLNWFMNEADKLDINGDGEMRTIFQLPPRSGKWKGSWIYEKQWGKFATAKTIIIGRNGKVPWKTISRLQYLTGLKNKYEKEIVKFKEGSGFERDHRQKLKHIEDYLTVAGKDNLQQPVIIDPNSGIWGFKGKFGNEDEGGYRLVLFGAGEIYFDKSLPRYAPQLIQLFWTSGRNPFDRHIKEQFEENFPLQKLKGMIR